MQEAAGELYTSDFDEGFAVTSPSNLFPGKGDAFVKSSEHCLGVLLGGGPAAGKIDESILGCG